MAILVLHWMSSYYCREQRQPQRHFLFSTMSKVTLSVGDLNDFIGPSQACIKPVLVPQSSGKVVVVVDSLNLDLLVLFLQYYYC